jgi:hypothetical protein
MVVPLEEIPKEKARPLWTHKNLLTSSLTEFQSTELTRKWPAEKNQSLVLKTWMRKDLDSCTAIH